MYPNVKKKLLPYCWCSPHKIKRTQTQSIVVKKNKIFSKKTQWKCFRMYTWAQHLLNGSSCFSHSLPPSSYFNPYSTPKISHQCSWAIWNWFTLSQFFFWYFSGKKLFFIFFAKRWKEANGILCRCYFSLTTLLCVFFFRMIMMMMMGVTRCWENN